MTALARAVWWTARNVPVDGEQFSRRDMWALTRPYWTYTALTTLADCGCRRRLGVWRTLWCVDHAFGPRGRHFAGGAS